MAGRRKLVTLRNLDIFDFIVSFKQQNDGVAPSVREISRHVKRSPSVVNYNLDRLEEAGLIARHDRTPRFITVLGGSWERYAEASDGSPA